MKIKLKPCPFCGYQYKGTAISFNGKATPFDCPDCGAEGPYINMGKGNRNIKVGMPQKYYDELSAKAWNTRAELQ